MSLAAMQWAFAQNAPASARIVLFALADYADAEGTCWPSVDALSAKAGLGTATVKRAISALVDLGLVIREHKRAHGGRFVANSYRLAMDQSDTRTMDQTVSTDQIDPWTMDQLVIPGKDKEPSIAISTTKGEPGINLIHGEADRPDWSQRLRQAHEILDQPGSHAQGGLAHSAELARLCRAGRDWELDLVPAIQKLAANFKRRGATLRSWTLIADDALAFRDRRLSGEVEPLERVVPFRPRRETAQQREDRVIEELKREGVI